MPRKPQLTEPVIVERLWANRQHDAVYVTLSTFRDHNLVDIRKHSMDRSGKLVPTPKGLALKITRLPDLAKAVNKALTKARELGLLDEAAE
jgi:ABC-type amino acid transport substrate-binding protein